MINNNDNTLDIWIFRILEKSVTISASQKAQYW
jgi:hypothetical protein